jgi:hypothetical protein
VRNFRAIYHMSDKKVVQLASADLLTVNPGADLTRAIGTSDLAYRKEVSWDQIYNDIYLIDLKTGARRKVSSISAATRRCRGRQVFALSMRRRTLVHAGHRDRCARQPRANACR